MFAGKTQIVSLQTYVFDRKERLLQLSFILTTNVTNILVISTRITHFVNRTRMFKIKSTFSGDKTRISTLYNHCIMITINGITGSLRKCPKFASHILSPGEVRTRQVRVLCGLCIGAPATMFPAVLILLYMFFFTCNY